MQMSAREQAFFWIRVRRSVHVKSHQDYYRPYPVLKLQLRGASRTSPHIEQKLFPVMGTGEFLSVVRPGRDGDRRRRVKKMLGHLHELVSFQLR